VAGEAPAAKVEYTAWLRNSKNTAPLLLHTMYRVKNLDATLRFYVDGLGMKMLDRIDIEARRATALFIGYTPDVCLELVNAWDAASPYSHGNGYGHIAVGVPDLAGIFTKLKAMGVEVIQRPMAIVEGGPLCSFVRDPDGYAVELVQTGE
jgi:lactoylglutathione lyase